MELFANDKIAGFIISKVSKLLVNFHKRRGSIDKYMLAPYIGVVIAGFKNISSIWSPTKHSSGW